MVTNAQSLPIADLSQINQKNTDGSEKSLGLNPVLLSLNLVWTQLQPSSNRVYDPFNQ